MIRISVGTASIMGMNELRQKEVPTTGYVMLGENCVYNCFFCNQGKNSYGSKDKLSRVTWPSCDFESFKQGLIVGEKNGLRRLCIQEVTTRDKNFKELRNNIISVVNKETSLPISLSSNVMNLKDVEELFETGVEKLGISLDVCNPTRYKEYKGGSYEARLDLIKAAAERFPGKVSTHIIVGLGESDRELLWTIDKLANSGVNIALFAFTPLKGTPLSNHNPPNVLRYRKIQAASYLIVNQLISFEQLIFSIPSPGCCDVKSDENDCLVGIDISLENFKAWLSQGDAFKTTGCLDCNRPYYNERPGATPFNFPGQLKEEESKTAHDLLISNLNFSPQKLPGKVKSAPGG